MKKILSLIILVILVPLFLSAQPTQQWAKRYSFESGYSNYVSDVILDAQGNSYLMGYISYSSIKQDLLMLKYDETGSIKWARKYSGGDTSKIFPVAMIIDNSGNIIVSCTWVRTSRLINDFLTIKYDNNGDTLWAKRFNCLSDTTQSLPYSVPRGITCDNNGDIYVTGVCHFGPANDSIGIVKYGETGNIIWIKYKYGGSKAVITDTHNNVYIAGGEQNTNVSYKFDEIGNQKWLSRDTIFSTSKTLIDRQNNYYLGGQYFNPTTFSDLALLKYDSDGNRKWLRTYGQLSNSHNDDFIDIVSDTLGNVYISGVSAHLNQIGWDYTTIKYNGNGDTMWVRIYNPVLASDDKANSIDVDKSGNVFVTGRSDYNFLGSKVATVIYNSIDQQKYVLTYDNNLPYSLHEGIKVKVNCNGSFIVSGNSMNSIGIYDIVIIKYSPVIGIQNISTEIPSSFSLSQNYPNPFNPSTKIRFSIVSSPRHRNVLERGSGGDLVQLKVYDVIGRKVQTLVNESLKPGVYEVTFDGSALNSGVYFYKLTTEEYSATKKMLLIK